jgi:hypothetical protein
MMDVGYKSNLLKKFTFRSLIPNFSIPFKDSVKARNLKNQKVVNFLDVVTKAIIPLSVVDTDIDS